MIWFGIVWNVVVFSLAIVDPHPSFDMKRCYVDRPTFRKVCWPKQGCWTSTLDGDVTCWRVVKVKPR